MKFSLNMGAANSKMKRPKIDKSRLEDFDRECATVLEYEKMLQDYLMQPGKMETIWTHEGAHLYYVRKVHPNAKIIPPSIIVEGARFVPLNGAIDLRGSDKKCDENRLLDFAKGVFAGGLLEAKIAIDKGDKTIKEIAADAGDADDIKNFGALCNEIRAASPDLRFEDADIRKDAHVEVWKDIHDPQIRKEIDMVVDEVKTVFLASMYPDGHADNE